MITVLTPTYNRGYIIEKAYNSLLKQTNKNFEWLIVDDGSTDNTKSLIDKYVKSKQIKIRYIYKNNGGKHTALNVGILAAKGELILVLDSDDCLTDNAIDDVSIYWKKYKNRDDVCGVTFIKKLINPIYKEKKFQECVSNMIDFVYNTNHLCDMCEVIRTDVLKQHLYPEFNNEKFLSEAIVLNAISQKYNLAFIPIEIYCAEYLEDGLSKNWFKLVVNNPMGARANNILFMSKKFKFRIRLKNCIMFNVFSFIAHKPIFKETKMKLFAFVFFIPSFFVAKYLEKKYKKQ